MSRTVEILESAKELIEKFRNGTLDKGKIIVRMSGDGENFYLAEKHGWSISPYNEVNTSNITLQDLVEFFLQQEGVTVK